MAGYNYGYHRDKMEKEFAQIASVCRAEGIAEDTIEIIHHILLDELNSNRRFHTHTQSYDGMRLPDDEHTSVDKNPLMDKFLKNFCMPQVEISELGQTGWIEDLDTPEIVIWVQSLDESESRLLSLLAMEGLKQKEAARILGKHDSAISRKMKQLRGSLWKILPEKSKKKYIV